VIVFTSAGIECLKQIIADLRAAGPNRQNHRYARLRSVSHPYHQFGIY